jgi:hypothetical protein
MRYSPPVVVPRPTSPPLLKIRTVLLAVPMKVGVVSLVMLSVLKTPVSEAASRSGMEGGAGAAVSIVTGSAPEGADSFPASSVAVAVMLWLP